MQGSKKKCRLGQVDFLSGQVAFHSHLCDGQGIKQVVCQLLSLKEQTMTWPRASKILAVTCPKGRMEFKGFFLSPEYSHMFETLT